MENAKNALARLSREKSTYSLVLEGKNYALTDVTISKTENPVNGPTARGNVYVEEARSYRIFASVDSQLSQALSATMLGPSTEFGGLRIVAESESGRTEIVGSLLSMSRTGGIARLQIAVTKILPQSA